MSPFSVALGSTLWLVVGVGLAQLPPPEKESRPTVDLDTQYNRALEAAATLAASLGERPRSYSRLRLQQSRLREEITRLGGGEESPAHRQEAVSSGQISAPAGPTSVSTDPTPEGQRIRQERATMRGPLPTPMPGESKGPATLVASAERVREACKAALGDLESLALELEQPEPDLGVVEDTLNRVQRRLSRLSEPVPPGPEESPPPQPRQP